MPTVCQHVFTPLNCQYFFKNLNLKITKKTVFKKKKKKKKETSISDIGKKDSQNNFKL